MAVAHHPDPVGQVLYLVEIVRGEQHGGPGAAQASDHVPGLPPRVRVEPGSRLVEEQHLRVTDQGQRQIQPARLPPGQGPHPRPALSSQADLLDRLRHIPRPGIEAGEQGDHLPDRQLGVHAARLQHDPDPLAEVAIAGARIEPEHPDRTTRPPPVPFEYLHRRGLARPVRPEQGVDLAAPDLEAHAIHGAHLAVVLAEPLHHDGGHLAGRLSSLITRSSAMATQAPQRPRSRGARTTGHSPAVTKPRRAIPARDCINMTLHRGSVTGRRSAVPPAPTRQGRRLARSWSA